MADTYPRFTVAAVQAAPVMFDRDKTLGKVLGFIEEAADKGAAIIGFPESFISGHPQLWFGAKTTNPLHEMGVIFKELIKNGVRVPSPETERLCYAARKAHAYVVVGINEVDNLYPGTVYISQLLISDEGEIIGIHRKMSLTLEEKLIYSLGDGSNLIVCNTRFGRLSSLNCGEHANDLIKYALLSMGTQLHVASWAPFPDHIYGKNKRDAVEFRVRQFAHAGKIFVINCCAISDKQNISVCCNNQEEMDNIVENTGGASSIVGPNGEYLSGPIYEGEKVLTAEITLEDALPGKQVHNVLGHYSRWDILSLNFNNKKLTPIYVAADNREINLNLFSELKQLREEIAILNEKLESCKKLQ